MELNCRKLKEPDIEDVCRLYINEDNITYSKEEFEKYVCNAKSIYKQMLDRNSYTFGCFDKNTLIGAINVNNILDYYPKYDKEPYVHLETFIVSKQYQNQGVGTFLMTSVFDLIKKEGVSYIIIQSQNPFVHKICAKVGLTDSIKDMRVDFINHS